MRVIGDIPKKSSSPLHISHAVAKEGKEEIPNLKTAVHTLSAFYRIRRTQRPHHQAFLQHIQGFKHRSLLLNPSWVISLSHPPHENQAQILQGKARPKGTSRHLPKYDRPQPMIFISSPPSLQRIGAQLMLTIVGPPIH